MLKSTGMQKKAWTKKKINQSTKIKNKNKKNKVDHPPHITRPKSKEGVIQYRHPAVKMSLQNCFPQVSFSLLRATKLRGLPTRVD